MNVIPEFNDFKTFYKKAVEPLKKQNIGIVRLDGKLKGDTRNTFAYFWYRDKKWRVKADTHIDRLKIAFDQLILNDDPFIIKPLRDHKSEILAIKGQQIRDSKFYVFLVV